MKKTITINISGYAFNIEEEAFDLLRKYLTDIRISLKGQDDVDETLTDIENRIAELFRASCPTTAQIVTVSMVQEVMGVMGMPQDFGDSEPAATNGDAWQQNPKTEAPEEPQHFHSTQKKLYRDVNNRVLGGVCSGLGAYFNIDATLVRVLFFASIFMGGVGLLVYIGLWIAMPPAETMAQRHEMMGGARSSTKSTEFSNTAFQYKPNSDRMAINALGRAIATVVGAIIALVGLILLSFLSMVIFWNHLFPENPNNPMNELFAWISAYVPANDFLFIQLALAAIIGIPLIMLVYGGIRLMLNIQKGNRFIGFIALLAWVSGIVFIVYVSIKNINAFKDKELPKQSMTLPLQNHKRLYLEPMSTDTIHWLGNESDDLGDVRIVLNHKTIYARKRPTLHIAEGDSCRLILSQHLYFHDLMENKLNPLRLHDLVAQTDSIIRIKSYFDLMEEKKGAARTIEYTLQIPSGYSLEINPLLKKYMKVE